MEIPTATTKKPIQRDTAKNTTNKLKCNTKNYVIIQEKAIKGKQEQTENK